MTPVAPHARHPPPGRVAHARRPPRPSPTPVAHPALPPPPPPSKLQLSGTHLCSAQQLEFRAEVSRIMLGAGADGSVAGGRSVSALAANCRLAASGDRHDRPMSGCRSRAPVRGHLYIGPRSTPDCHRVPQFQSGLHSTVRTAKPCQRDDGFASSRVVPALSTPLHGGVGRLRSRGLMAHLTGLPGARDSGTNEFSSPGPPSARRPTQRRPRRHRRCTRRPGCRSCGLRPRRR